MKKLLFLLVILTAILFQSCKKEVNCAGFPEGKLVLMPYTEGQVLTYTNGNKKFNLTMGNVYFTEGYVIPNSQACECESKAYTYSAIDTASGFKIDCSAEERGQNRYQYIFSVKHYGYLGQYYVMRHDDQFTTIERNGKFDVKFDSTLTIGNKTYNNVISMQIDTIDQRTTEIYRIFVAKGSGIVRMDGVDGSKWLLEE